MWNGKIFWIWGLLSNWQKERKISSRKHFSSKKSLFHTRSGSQNENQLMTTTERVLKFSSPEPFHSKQESAALGWISKAFDLERFNLEIDDKSQSNSMHIESPNYQINKFNNSASINSKVFNESRTHHIDAQRLLFSLIRFDFLKNEGNDIDFERLILEDSTRGGPTNSSQAALGNLGNLRNIVIDPSLGPKSMNLELKPASVRPPENTGIPQQTSNKMDQVDQEKYKVNGGIVRMEVMEKLFLTFEDMKDNPPKITGKIVLKEKGFTEPQEYQIKWPSLDSSEIITKESEILASKGRKFSSTSVGLTSTASSQLLKSELYMYKINPQLLRKSITPLLIEPKFLDSAHDDLNLRLLLNPKYRENLLKIDLKILTSRRPKKSGGVGMEGKIVDDGLETKLVLEDFGNELSWKTKIGLEKGNKVVGVWLVAHFKTTLFPQFMPKVGIRAQDDGSHFSENKMKMVACDHRLVFEYQRKLVNF